MFITINLSFNKHSKCTLQKLSENQSSHLTISIQTFYLMEGDQMITGMNLNLLRDSSSWMVWIHLKDLRTFSSTSRIRRFRPCLTKKPKYSSWLSTGTTVTSDTWWESTNHLVEASTRICLPKIIDSQPKRKCLMDKENIIELMI